ncbi:MAG: mechanosensitive ion channel family protein [Salinivirgaceae bacterium]|nr:mechanosensitive ion channel family protein [Salinivirgaceae bacterium]
MSNKISFLFFLLVIGYSSNAQLDSFATVSDSLQKATELDHDSANATLMTEFSEKLAEIEEQRKVDSIKKAELENQLMALKTTDNINKKKLLEQLEGIEKAKKARIDAQNAKIELMRKTAQGYPVKGVLHDTLFFVFTRLGTLNASQRAINVSEKIRLLYKDDYLVVDSIRFAPSDGFYDIVYKDVILMSISETDALWYNRTMSELANQYAETIKKSLLKARDEHSIGKFFMRLGLSILVLATSFFIIWIVGKGYYHAMRLIVANKTKFLKDLSYKDYTFITSNQELKVVLLLLSMFRWFLYGLFLYITLPVLFSVFPFTRGWADSLFTLILIPFKAVFSAIWAYLPNMFYIIVIYLIMRYVIRFVKYIFSEVQSEKLKLSGFHADWAMPTFTIVQFLLYAFMFVMIFPYLPGSNSDIFKGVSVFIGVLFSLGSSSAIANMIAGLVITYMRPFKIGDRIKIGETTGDVLEKTLLVTRLKTVKNEIITIPNAAVLTGSTINYSQDANNQGLIVHTTVTIGYDVPWINVHEALIEAALRSVMILKEPLPFVLQTGLDDFYVAYQLNAYTREANKQGTIYSSLHSNIQNVFNEKGIEILSPHYRAQRDGNQTTIPANYLSTSYSAPIFNVKVEITND